MSAIHHMPGHLIRRLHQIHGSVFADRMRAAGLDLTTPQFATLVVLSEEPGIDQATLARLISLDRPTTGGVVERLEAKGLIAREPSPRDGRAKALSLTCAGQVLLIQVRPIATELQAEILPGLDAAERARFVELATKAVGAAHPAPPNIPEAQHDG